MIRGRKKLCRQLFQQQEWEKEFYGEGQYYYFLKRNGKTSVSGPNGSKKPNYVIPLPESETNNRRD